MHVPRRRSRPDRRRRERLRLHARRRPSMSPSARRTPRAPTTATSRARHRRRYRRAGSSSSTSPAARHGRTATSVDCTVDGTCVYAAWDAARLRGALTTAPLRIAAEVPGTLTVTPSTGLHDGDVVTVTGDGWPADQFLDLYECDGPTSPRDLRRLHDAVTDDHGHLLDAVQVNSHLRRVRASTARSRPVLVVVAWYPERRLRVVCAADRVRHDTDPGHVALHRRRARRRSAAPRATLGVTTARSNTSARCGLAFVLGITHTPSITPAPDTGRDTLTTNWLPSEYSGHERRSRRRRHDHPRVPEDRRAVRSPTSLGSAAVSRQSGG